MPNPKKFPLEEDALERADKAKAQCKAAATAIPQKYWGYLQRISHKQFYRRKGQKYGNDCQWSDLGMVEITNAYMRVDGRIAMCRDLHQEMGQPYSISQPQVVWLPMTDEVDKEGRPARMAPHASVDVESSLLGTHNGTARVFFAEKGVNATNPWENGITSALGRALGSMGFGLVESGMASAEEMKAAFSAHDALDPVPEGQDTPREEKPAPAASTASAGPKGGKGVAEKPKAKGKKASKKAKKEEPKATPKDAPPAEGDDNPYAMITAYLAEKAITMAQFMEWATDEGLLPEGKEESGEITDISLPVAKKLAEDFNANVKQPLSRYLTIIGLFAEKGLEDGDVQRVREYVQKQRKSDAPLPWSSLPDITADFFLNHWEKAWGIIQKG